MSAVINTLPTKPEKLYLNTSSLLKWLKEAYDLPLSRVTLHRAHKAGKLNPRKIGGRCLYSIPEVKNWVEGPQEEAHNTP